MINVLQEIFASKPAVDSVETRCLADLCLGDNRQFCNWFSLRSSLTARWEDLDQAPVWAHIRYRLDSRISCLYIGKLVAS